MIDIALDFKEETASVNRLSQSLEQLKKAADAADKSSLDKLRGAIQALGLSSKEQLLQIAKGTASILDKFKADVNSNQVGQIFNPTAIKYNLDAVNQLVRSSAERMTTTLAMEAGKQAEARAIAAKEGAAKEVAAEESKRDGIIREMVRARAAGEAINAQELRDLEAHYAKTKALAVLDANARFQAMTASAQKLREARVEQLLASGAKPTAVVSKYGSDPVLTALNATEMEKTAVTEAAAQKHLALQEKLAAEANARLIAQNLKLHEALTLSDSTGSATRLERMSQVYAALARQMELAGANELRIKKLYGEAITAEDLRQTAGRLAQRAGGMRGNLADVAQKKTAVAQTATGFATDVAIAREQEKEASLYRAYSVKLAAAVEESNRLVKSTKLEGLFSLHRAVEVALATGAEAELATRIQYGSAVVDAIQKNSSREIRAIITAREAAAVAAKSGATSIATLGVSSTGSLVETGTRGVDHSKAKVDTDKLGDSTKALTAHTHLLNDGFRGLVQSLGMYSASMTAIIPMMAGVAAGMAAIKPLKVGAEFEQSMFVIHELAGTTTADMVKVKEAVLEMGASTQYGPLEVAKGLEILTLAGLSTLDALQAIKPVLNFASTGGVSLEAAAETLVAVATAYKYSAKNFEVVGDVIAKTAADTMASVTDMSAAFTMSTVVAQQYGASLQDTAMAFGMLAQVGIRGTSAGTAYRNMLTEFNKGSGKAADGIKLLGVELKNADGSAKDLMTTMESLSKGLITKNSVSQGRLLDDIGNERGGKGIASFQAAFTAELNKTNPLLQREVDLLIQSGKASEAKRVAEEAVAATYAKMRDVAAKSAESTGGYTFLANLEKQFITLGSYKGLLASLQTDFVKAFDTASDSTKLLALSLRETLNTPEFTAGIAAITNAALGAADAFAKLAAFTLDEPIAAVAGLTAAFLTAQAAVAALPMLLSAAAAGITSVGYSLGMTAALIAGAFEISAGAAILAVGGVALAVAAVVTGIGYFIYSVMDSQSAVEKAEAAKREEFIKTASTQTELQEKTITAQQGQLDAEVARIGVLNDVWIKNRKLTELANAYDWQSLTVTGGKTSEAGKALHAAAETLRAQRMTNTEAEAKAAGEAMQARIDQWKETKLQIIDAIRVQKEYNLQAAGGMILGSYSENLAKIHEEATASTKAATTFADAAKARADAAAKELAARSQLQKNQAALDAAESKARVSGTGVGGYTGKPKFTRSPHVEQVKLETTNILEETSKRDKLVLDATKAAATNRKAILDSELAANMISQSEHTAQIAYLEKQTTAATIADLNKQQDARAAAYIKADEEIDKSQKKFNALNAGNATAIGKNDEHIAAVRANNANKLVTDYKTTVSTVETLQNKAYADAIVAENRHQAELHKIKQDALDWEASEVELKAKNARETANAAAIRNATPLQAAVLTAQNSEFERLTANANKYDAEIKKLTKSVDTYNEIRSVGTDLDSESANLADERAKANDKELEKLALLVKRKADLTGGIPVAVQIKGEAGADEFIRLEVARIRDGLTEAIINSGKDGGKALREILEAELLTKPFKMVIEAFLQPITTSIAQGIVGSTVGAGGGLGSLVGAAGLSGGSFMSGAAAAMNGATGLALEGGAAMLKEATSMAGAAKGLAQMAGALAPYAAAAAVAAGMINRAQGSVSAAGTFVYGRNSATGFQTGGRADFIQDGGGGTTLNSSWFDPGEETSKYMSAMADLVTKSVKEWAEAVGLSADAVTGYTETVQAAIGDGMTKAEERASIDKAMAGYGDAMVQSLFSQIMAFAKPSEAPSATLERMGNDVAAVNNILRDNGQQLYDTSFESAKAVQLLINSVGGLDKFTALASTLETVNDVMTRLGQNTFELSMDGAQAADKLARSVGGADKLSTMADELIHVNENLAKLGQPLLDISVASAEAAHGMVKATDSMVAAQEKAEKLQASYDSFASNLSGTDNSSVASLQAAFNKAMAAVTASVPSISSASGLSSVTYDQYSSYNDPQRAKLDTAASAFKNLQDAIDSAAKTAQESAKTAQDAADTAAQAYQDALKSVEDSTRDVNQQLKDFGKTDFQKKLSQIAYAGQDKQAELDKLSAKATELSATANSLSIKASNLSLDSVASISNGLISASIDLSEDSQTVADNIKDTLANSTAALGDALTLVPAISALFDGILAGLLKIPPALDLVKAAVTGVGGAALGAADGLNSFGNAAVYAGQSATGATGPLNSVGAAFTAVAPAASAAGAALTALGGAFTAAAAALSSLTGTFNAASGALDGLNAAFASAASGLNSLGSAFESTAASGASLAGSLSGVGGALGDISGAASSAAGSISAAAGALSAAAGAASSVQAPATPVIITAASGGAINGPGTSTSDSIPAMLSDGEYVIKASSVDKYGTGFLNALNAGTLKSTIYRADGGAVDANVAAQVQNEYQGRFTSLLGDFGGVIKTFAQVSQDLSKFDISGLDSSEVKKFFLDLLQSNKPDAAGKFSVSSMAVIDSLDAASSSIGVYIKTLDEQASWQEKLSVLMGTTTERELALKKDLASTTDAETQNLIKQVYAQEDLNKAREAEAKALESVQDALKTFKSESSSLQADLNSALGSADGDARAKAIRENLALEDARKAATDANTDTARETLRLAEEQYNLNEARKEEIKLLTDSKTTLKSYTDAAASKEVEKMRLQGNDAGANSAQKAIDLADVYKSTADAIELLKTESTELGKSALQTTIANNDATIAQYEKNAALDKEIEVLNRYKSIKDDADATYIEMLKATGQTAEAAALEFDNATEGLDALQVATYRETEANKALIASRNSLASTASALASGQVNLLAAKGQTAAAAALQRSIDVKPFEDAIKAATDAIATLDKKDVSKLSEGEKASIAKELATWNDVIDTNETGISNYDETKRIEAEIVALNAASEAAKAAASAAEAAASAFAQVKQGLADTFDSLSIDLLRTQGKTTEADALQRIKDLGAQSVSGLLKDAPNAESISAVTAAYDANQQLRGQIAVAKSASDLQKQLDDLNDSMLTAAARTDKQRAALDESNRVLFDQVQLATQAKKAADERVGLQNQLDDLTLTSVGLLDKQRAALDESNHVLFESVQVATKAKKVDDQRKDLYSQIDDLTLNSTQLRLKERDAIETANRGLFDRLQALKDEAAYTETMRGLSDSRESAQADLLRAQGDTQGEDAIQRGIELGVQGQSGLLKDARDLMDAYYITALYDSTQYIKEQTRITEERNGLESQLLQVQGDAIALRKSERDAIDASNSLLFDRINALKDEKEAVAALQTVAQQYKSFIDDVDSAKSAVDSASSSITGGYLDALDAVTAAQEEVANVTKQAGQELFNFGKQIRDFVDELNSTKAGGLDIKGQAAAAQADYAITLAQAQSGDKDALGKITNKASTLLGLAETTSISQTEYRILAGQVKGQLFALSEKLTTENAAVAAEADPMVVAQEKLANAQKDLTLWTKAVSESSASTDREVTDYAKDWRKANTAYLKALGDKNLADAIVGGLDMTLKTPLQDLATAVQGFTDALSLLRSTPTGAATATGVSGGTKQPVINLEIPQADIIVAAQAESIRLSDMYSNMVTDGIQANRVAIDTFPSFFFDEPQVGYSLPSFDIGTNRVPRDMLAMVHKDEAIVPPAYNPAIGGGNQNTERLEKLVEALTSEVQRLQALQRDNNVHTRRTADATNGAPEAPMLTRAT